MSQKIVINICYGGFGISKKALMRYIELAGINLYPYHTVSHNKLAPGEYESSGLDYTFWFKSVLKDNVFQKELYFNQHDIKRDDPFLVKVVEELGEAANQPGSQLKVVEIPDGVRWEIGDYDGCECVSEVHQSWS